MINRNYDQLETISALILSTLRPKQNCRHFSDNTFNRIFVIESVGIRWNVYWSLFLSVQLTICQYWFRLWLGADQATSHYLDQWWLDYRRIDAPLGLIGLNRSVCYYKLPHIFNRVIVKVDSFDACLLMFTCWSWQQNSCSTRHLGQLQCFLLLRSQFSELEI